MRSSTITELKMGLFEDIFKDAFANDENLSSDKSEDQLEYKGDSDDDYYNFTPKSSPSQQTEVQKRWIAAQEKAKKNMNRNEPQEIGTAGIRGAKGAPINPTFLIGTTWILDLYLAGVPERDPSNDLYGSRVNISNRDRTVGLGALVPEEPNISLKIFFEEDGVCRAESTEFTTGEVGEYKLSEDNRFIRFSMDTLGFQRVVKTTGSITKVFWSKEEDTVTKTSSTYSIPKGIVYADASIGYGKPGELVMGDGSKPSDNNGVLRVEQRMGVLGAATKMVACGKFSARMVVE